MHGIGSEAAGHSFIYKHDTWTSSNLPSLGIVYPIDCLLVHEEERVTILLNTGLKSIRACHRPVAPGWPSMNEQGAFAALRAKDKPGLNDIWEDKHGPSLATILWPQLSS